MDFSYSEDQEALRNLSREILADKATHERLCEIEAGDEGWDRELWAELCKASLVGACLPGAFGGMDLGIIEMTILLEEVGRAVAPVPLWATLALAALPIAELGNDEQKQRWLPGVVSGEVILTGAFEEPDSVNPLEPSTKADRDAKGWRLYGTKICVQSAHVAARVLVPAHAEDGKIGLFLIDPKASGVKLERQRATNREPVFTLVLEGARAEQPDVLQEPTSDESILRRVVERATVGLCAMQLGVADRALRMTAEYTTEREQFNRPIGSFQAVHTRAADAYVQVEAMRVTLQQAAFLLSENRPASIEVSVAKYWAAQGGSFTTYAAQHLHGGIGIDNDYPLHRSYIWSRHLELTLGAAANHLEWIGDQLAETPSVS
ncbi:MAG: acyl-CoA/acyl-ACP dehydrogenase [bacterium]|nr:acyl-CoA/acyl-ACP dehydrogenase [bacterium]